MTLNGNIVNHPLLAPDSRAAQLLTVATLEPATIQDLTDRLREKWPDQSLNEATTRSALASLRQRGLLHAEGTIGPSGYLYTLTRAGDEMLDRLWQERERQAREADGTLDASVYLLHTLKLHGYEVPSLEEAMRQHLLTASDLQSVAALFGQWREHRAA